MDDDESNILFMDGYSDESCQTLELFNFKKLSNDKKKIMIKNQLPWIEKYRPKHIDDIILNNNTLTKINKIIEEKNMPNIIITGIPGIGKTTTIKSIANKLYGKNVENAVLSLNASDDRGIKIVEELITNFCKKMLNIDTNKYAHHKLIILDEADNITSKAQHLINKKMTEYNKTTRFAFTCNKSSDIIEAIQSRCIILRYLRLPKEKIIEKLKYICKMENIIYHDDAINEIAILSQGDMRSAINNLQIIYNGLNKITITNIYKVCNKPQPIILLHLLKCCKELKIKESFEILENLKNKGYSNSDIILGILNVLKLLDKNNNDITEKDKMFIINETCKKAYIISKGVTSDLQVYSCISSIILGYKNKSIEF
jgi:replication factor C subunit 2/4